VVHKRSANQRRAGTSGSIGLAVRLQSRLNKTNIWPIRIGMGKESDTGLRVSKPQMRGFELIGKYSTAWNKLMHLD
jgi:hypothetical protein